MIKNDIFNLYFYFYTQTFKKTFLNMAYDADITEFLNSGIISDNWSEERMQYAFSLLDNRNIQQETEQPILPNINAAAANSRNVEQLYLPTTDELYDCKAAMESEPGGKEEYNRLFALRKIRDNAKFSRERILRNLQDKEFNDTLQYDSEKTQNIIPPVPVVEAESVVELSLAELRAIRIARFSKQN
jgi:hypothetical protein